MPARRTEAGAQSREGLLEALAAVAERRHRQAAQRALLDGYRESLVVTARLEGVTVAEVAASARISPTRVRQIAEAAGPGAQPDWRLLELADDWAAMGPDETLARMYGRVGAQAEPVGADELEEAIADLEVWKAADPMYQTPFGLWCASYIGAVCERASLTRDLLIPVTVGYAYRLGMLGRENRLTVMGDDNAADIRGRWLDIFARLAVEADGRRRE